MTLRDDFELGVHAESWPEVYGADTASHCGVVVSGRALTFYKVFHTVAGFCQGRSDGGIWVYIPPPPKKTISPSRLFMG